MRSSGPLGLAGLLVVASCSHGSTARLHEKMIDLVQAEEHELVRRWEGAPGETFLITQRGPIFTKWRVHTWVVTESIPINYEKLAEALADLDEPICLSALHVPQVGDTETRGEALGRVDTLREQCFDGGDTIDCDQLRDDPDLAQYITWLDD